MKPTEAHTWTMQNKPSKSSLHLHSRCAVSASEKGDSKFESFYCDGINFKLNKSHANIQFAVHMNVKVLRVCVSHSTLYVLRAFFCAISFSFAVFLLWKLWWYFFIHWRLSVNRVAIRSVACILSTRHNWKQLISCSFYISSMKFFSPP